MKIYLSCIRQTEWTIDHSGFSIRWKAASARQNSTIQTTAHSPSAVAATIGLAITPPPIVFSRASLIVYHRPETCRKAAFEIFGHDGDPRIRSWGWRRRRRCGRRRCGRWRCGRWRCGGRRGRGSRQRRRLIIPQKEGQVDLVMRGCLVECAENVDIVIFAVVKIVMTGLVLPGHHKCMVRCIGCHSRIDRDPLDPGLPGQS